MLPLFVISESDGIPIPSQQHLVDISSISKTYFHSKPNGNKNLVVLGISSHVNPESLLGDLKDLAPYLHKIGILCDVKQIDEADNYELCYLDPIERVFIRDISQERAVMVGSSDLLYVRYEPVPEGFHPAEDELPEEIQELTTLIISNSAKFDTTMVGLLNDTDDLLEQMNIFAAFMIVKQSVRNEYIQAESHIHRMELIKAELKNNLITKKKRRLMNKKSKANTKQSMRPNTPEEVRSLIETLDMPKHVKSILYREADRLDNLNKGSAEYSSVLDYLAWSFELPWEEFSFQDFDLKDFVKSLDETHYGLDQVKQHVLEHMTIEKIRGKTSGTVLTLCGPPGTGKTSIAQAIAEVTNRQLIRIPLGGVSDDAEIRGHRRTYVASRPGRFVAGLKSSGTMDPLFLLDEIDKLHTGRGDPASALLEVLDSQQNSNFIDLYLEYPIDLSNCMFICTANYEEQIPPALKDRMEIIYFREYSLDERQTILRDFLVPKALAEYSLQEHDITIDDEVLDKISQIVGVRSMGKRLRKLLRMAAVDIVVHDKPSVTIDIEYLEKMLAQSKKENTKSVGFNNG